MVRSGMVTGGAAIVAMTSVAAVAQTPAQAVRPAITRALSDSAAGWNAGDLDRFMAVYKRSPDITYISGGEVVRGFAAIRARYAGRFAGRGDKGQLAIDILDARPAGTGYVYVIGRYHLHRSAGADLSGITTLLFEHVGTGWLIIADHS